MGVMIALSRLKRLSVYGVSVGGAAAHNCGQVAAAVLTLGNTAPLYYLPVLLGVSLFTGALTGLIAACLFRALAHTRLWGGVSGWTSGIRAKRTRSSCGSWR